MTAVTVASEVALFDDELELCCPGRGMYTRLRACGAVPEDESTIKYATEQTNATIKTQKNALLMGCDFFSGCFMAQILHPLIRPNKKG